jgi:hypothetical protein
MDMLMKIFRWLIGFVVLNFIQTAFAINTLPVFDNQYTAKLYGLSVDVTNSLKLLPDGSYELYFNADAVVGSITEKSQFKWNQQEQTVIPLKYNYSRSGLGKSREDKLNFDWNKHEIHNASNDISIAINPAQKVQDNISYQLQLQQDLLAGKNNLIYPLTDGKKIKEYSFEIVGEEMLSTPLGNVNTVKIKRTHKDTDRSTFVWFAKNFHYMLVRLQQEENGSAYTIYLSKASLNGKAIEHF